MKIIDYLLIAYTCLTLCVNILIIHLLMTNDLDYYQTMMHYVTTLVFNIMMIILIGCMINIKYDDNYTYYHTTYSLFYKNK